MGEERIVDIEETRAIARRAMASLERKFEKHGHTWGERSRRMHEEARTIVEGNDRRELEIWTIANHLPEDHPEMSSDTREYMEQQRPLLEKELGIDFSETEPFPPGFLGRLMHGAPEERE